MSDEKEVGGGASPEEVARAWNHTSGWILEATADDVRRVRKANNLCPECGGGMTHGKGCPEKEETR